MARQVSIDLWFREMTRALTIVLTDKTARARLLVTLRKVVAVARSIAPKRTGAFRRSLAPSIKANRGRTSVRIGIASRVDNQYSKKQNIELPRGRVRFHQAIGIEYGNANIKPTRPMHKALDITREAIIKDIEEITRVRIRRIERKGERIQVRTDA